MSLARLSWLILIVFLASNGQERTPQVALTVDTSKVVGRIDPKIYGQFYELIYHSGNGGLWGDMIFNRSFEPLDAPPRFVSRWKYAKADSQYPRTRYRPECQARFPGSR
jgi:hypothetical protein